MKTYIEPPAEGSPSASSRPRMNKSDIKRLKELMALRFGGDGKSAMDALAANDLLADALIESAPALLAAYEDAERYRAALNHQRSALALVRDRQCHDGVCTIAIADLEQGIRQIDAAMGDKP